MLSQRDKQILTVLLNGGKLRSPAQYQNTFTLDPAPNKGSTFVYGATIRNMQERGLLKVGCRVGDSVNRWLPTPLAAEMMHMPAPEIVKPIAAAV